MSNEKEIKSTCTLLRALDVDETNKFIAVRENGLADANFIITNLMKQILINENNKICFIIMHNTIGHYQNIALKLNYDLLKKSKLGVVDIVEVMKLIVGNINNPTININCLLSTNKEGIAKDLCSQINSKIENLLLSQETGRVYLIMDDISHLLDIGVDLKYVLSFINCCAQFITNPRVSIIINSHVCGTIDEIIANALSYIADLNVDVSPLKTGISHLVSGVIRIHRKNPSGPQSKSSIYHYKAYDREIKVFLPGQIVHGLPV